MDKESQTYRILGEIKKYQNESEEGTASIFILVDPAEELATAHGFGNTEILSQGFEHIMKTNPEFNKIMKAMFGLHLHQNPKEKEEFFRGLELIKNTPKENL